jgi:hypothetical protein
LFRTNNTFGKYFVMGEEVTLFRGGEAALFRRKAALFRGEAALFRGEAALFRGEVALFRGEVALVRGKAQLFRREVTLVRGKAALFVGGGVGGAILGAGSFFPAAVGSFFAAAGNDNKGKG